ncbi:MAG: murein biosynthesis integral membrane protein MurJ [Chloroflexota bacterium]
MTDAATTSPARVARLSHVARSSLLIGVLFGIDKGLGLLRQVVVGRQFGVSAELDAFNAANNLPDLLFALISGGALAIAFIPVLSQVLERQGRQAAWDLFSRVANWAFLITGAAAILLAVFAGPLVRAELGVAPGFTPQLQSLVADLMRLDLIATLIFSISGLVIAGLQANQHFFLPALAPAVFDLGQIFGALVLAPEVGYPLGSLQLPAAGLGVHGLVYGAILGAALHLGVQVPGLIRYRFHWRPRLGVNHPGLRQVARLMGPRILTIGAFNLVFVVQDNLASRLNLGSVTALTYGWLIMQVPETILGTAIGTALLPTLAEHFARGDNRAFEDSVARGMRVLLSLSLPMAGVLAVCLRPLIQGVFDFEPRGTELVVWAARAYLLGLVGHSLLELAARAFYARQNARVPMLAAALGTAVFITLGSLLYRPLGATGIGLSNSLAFSLQTFLLLVLLSRSFPSVLRQGQPALRGLLGTALGALAAWTVLQALPASLLLGGLAALMVGGAVSLPFIGPELRELVRL